MIGVVIVAASSSGANGISSSAGCTSAAGYPKMAAARPIGPPLSSAAAGLRAPQMTHQRPMRPGIPSWRAGAPAARAGVPCIFDSGLNPTVVFGGAWTMRPAVCRRLRSSRLCHATCCVLITTSSTSPWPPFFCLRHNDCDFKVNDLSTRSVSPRSLPPNAASLPSRRSL